MPACVAWMTHAPAAFMVAVLPLTVQMDGVAEAKVTVKPLVAVAESVTLALTNWLPTGGEQAGCGPADGADGGGG